MSTDRRKIIVGSRESQLALKQTNIVIGMLEKLNIENVDFKIKTMKTMGDKILDVALSKIGEKSLFTKELENGLFDKSIDLVVHSLKDLPTVLPDNMVIGSVLKREDPRDAVVMHPKHELLISLDDLPPKSVIGTSSLRRIAQLKRSYPHFIFKDIRGNLNTRLKKLDSANDYDAIILAYAGISRMGWSDRITQVLNSDICMYAVSQGALAVECRSDDKFILEILHKLNHFDTLVKCITERTFLQILEGGCSAPVAVHTQLISCMYTNEDKVDSINLTGGVFSLDGKQSKILSALSGNFFSGLESFDKETIFACIDTSFFNVEEQKIFKIAQNIGSSLAEKILDAGGRIILKEAKEETERSRLEQN